MFAAHLYVEGGDYDGCSFVVGPFAEEEEAQHCANELDAFGTTEVLPLYGSATGTGSAYNSLVRMLDDGRNHVS